MSSSAIIIKIMQCTHTYFLFSYSSLLVKSTSFDSRNLQLNALKFISLIRSQMDSLMHIHANISLAFHFLIRFIIKASSNEEEILMPRQWVRERKKIRRLAHMLLLLSGDQIALFLQWIKALRTFCSTYSIATLICFPLKWLTPI